MVGRPCGSRATEDTATSCAIWRALPLERRLQLKHSHQALPVSSRHGCREVSWLSFPFCHGLEFRCSVWDRIYDVTIHSQRRIHPLCTNR